MKAVPTTQVSVASLGSVIWPARDLKESYRAHAPPRYRFIYNAIYSEQVRTYEINGLPDGGGGMIDAEVLSAEVSPDFLVHFPFWPWSGKRAVAELNDVEMKLLRTSLEASGFFDSPPRSARFSTLIRSIGWSAPVRATASTSMPGPIRRRNSPTCASLKSCAALTAPRSHSRKRANCRPTKKSSAPSRQLRKMSGPAISAFFAEILHDGLRTAARP